MSAVMPLPNLRTRAMTADDVEQVVAIENVSYGFPWSRGIFFDCLRVGYACRVLELDGEIIGYGIVSALVREAHILNVCLAPAFRRLGFGRFLLNELFKVAADKHVREVYLEVRPSNRAALRLYRRFGFEQVGVRRNYYRSGDGREDALVLRVRLDARGERVPAPGVRVTGR